MKITRRRGRATTSPGITVAALDAHAALLLIEISVSSGANRTMRRNGATGGRKRTHEETKLLAPFQDDGRFSTGAVADDAAIA